jgi:hypothetical protein
MNQSIDHSSVGALIAMRGEMTPVAFVVAGHHGPIRSLYVPLV